MNAHMSRRVVGRAAIVAVTALAMVMGGATSAHADTGYPSDASQPDLVKLLGQYEDYYKPANAYDSKNPSSFGKGSVIDKTVLAHDDEFTQAINNDANTGSDGKTPTAQQQRALVDSDYNMSETLPDSLGPIISQWFTDGLNSGKLPKTAELLTQSGDSLLANYLNTGTAKNTFNHPRPFVDRTDAGYAAAGLQKTVGIVRVPAWTDAQKNKHDPGYDSMATSGSFPSGHTTYAYSGGIGLATLFPQLASEIVTRASEAGNNRIVLGVHYPLDIMGGRIDGEAANTARWSDAAFRDAKLMPAYDELQGYIADACVRTDNATKQQTDYDTVEQCVTKLGANADKGYTNAFTDAVSTKPVTDRTSAIDAYTARLTYGFSQDATKAGQPAVVPEGAGNLLLTAFPTLTDAQRQQVLKASEIDSGYPLDGSSQGYQRLNLAKAYSANVTLSADGSTILSITFGNKAPTVTRVKAADGITSLLSDFNNYWKAGVGVTDAGKSVLAHDDELTESINNKAFAEGANGQDARAVSDAQMNSTNTLYDALGPVLGTYYKDAMDKGTLPKTTAYLKAMDASASTSIAKTTYQHPRPYVDRENYLETSLGLNGLKQTLGIKEVAAYQDFNWGDGSPNVNEYDALHDSGSFPSGHTTFAFTQGAGLASILPELGPEIMTRVSEAGNNRIVLGVHYPLDILGGHIAGQYGVATALNDPAAQREESDARTELVGYLTARCKADGHGDTIQQCVDATGANGDKGYTNAFTDAVSTKPVTDRASALDAYKARMTYGFQRTGAAGAAAVVPDEAVNLLNNVSAFATLSKDQKKAVLAATEGDSGYPLDATSKGWARLDLAAAYSAKVTLSADGTKVISVEPGQAVASVVREGAQPKPAPAKNTGAAHVTTSQTSVHVTGRTGNLASTGAEVLSVLGAALALVLAGGLTLTAVRRRHR